MTVVDTSALSTTGWTFLDTFSIRSVASPPAPRSWAAVDAMGAAALAAGIKAAGELSEHLDRWDDALRDFGGDPSRHDWHRFRPLRLSREEDWSDWLAALIERSEHGFLARELLGRTAHAYRATRVDREIPTAEGYRADVVVLWADNIASHIEVKIGDQSFEKTFGTALALRGRYPHVASWTDHILLPEESQDAWNAMVRRAEPVPVPVTIGALTWESIAIALRIALFARAENNTWIAWALAFCGAIEGRILQLPSRPLGSTIRPRTISGAIRLERHLKIIRGGEDGYEHR